MRVGSHHTAETRARIGAAHVGRPKSAEHRAKLSASLIRQRGVGADAGYQTRHRRAQRTLGRAADQLCTDCSLPAAEWSQVYGTDGLDVYADYEARCHSCHVKYDRRVA